MNAKYPDFEQKNDTGGTLQHGDSRNPPWVEAEVAAMAPPGTVQLRMSDLRKRWSFRANGTRMPECLDKCTFVPMLSACTNFRAVEGDSHFHKQIIQSGFESGCVCGGTSCLVEMCAKCGSMEIACNVSNKIACMMQYGLVDVEMGECMAKRIRGMPCGFSSVAQVDPGNAAGYVLALLKHLCCGLQAGMSVRSCERSMAEKWKRCEEIARSHLNSLRCIRFVVVDGDHPQTAEIRAELKRDCS